MEGIPVPKGRPRFGKGRVYTPKRTAQWEKHIRENLADFPLKEPLDVPISIVLSFYMPRPKRLVNERPQEDIPHIQHPDLDNLVKAVMDAMNSYVFTDDKLVYSVQARKSYAQAGTPAGVGITVGYE